TAIILNRKIAGRGFFRSVFFYPVLLSPIVVALIWKWILQENGLFNGILDGMGRDKVMFLTNVTWARFWVIMISVWAYMGFYTLILLAGLQAIPTSLYEAAQIDGASAWEQFRRITMPLLRPTMLVVVILALIRAVQVFDIIFAFTRGGPGTATLSLVQYIYEIGFASPSRRFGIASSASILMAGVLVIATLLQLYINREED
ncbi:MAG: sugar ABC transporter permease, partial [Chloroflexota bacterium]